MRSWIRCFLVLGLVTAAAVPARAQGVATESAVRTAMSGFMDALNALDADRMATYFADDISAFVPSAQNDRVNGKAAVDRIFQVFSARTRTTTTRLSLVPEDLTVDATPQMAVVTFNIREPAINTTRRRTFVWKRVGDRWLISHFHASDFVSVPK
jgi:ketosteroid isomerase-like protein